MASDTPKTAKIIKKVILPTSTSPKCQCAAEQCDLITFL